jgi:predicted NACHT family NTPase
MKMELTYEWKRFWCPRTKFINLSDNGFLYDPESEYGKYFNTDLVQLEDIFDQHCIILLGEPGMGKSFVLQSNRPKIEGKVSQNGGKLIWKDLRSFGNEVRLIDELFKCPLTKSWIAGDYPLYMFLDSLDECLLHIDTVASIIAEQIKDLPTDRLFLRIACRTAEWPITLEKSLSKIWNETFISVLELAPLRKTDVSRAAKVNGINSQSFIEELDRVGVVPLAIKPVTLSFLLNTFRKEGAFPDTQQELYFKGCSLLCEETNEMRRDSGYRGRLGGQERLKIASYIAAAMIFSNKYAIWTGINFGDVPEEDIPIQYLANINGVHENLIRETISTGLFSSRGPNRMGWAHQTYAEYLAAFCLIQNEMDPHQILTLIKHPFDEEGKLVPQLYETSAWLAGMNNEVFDGIMETDPDILLRSGITSADAQSKERLVDRLLKAFREERLLDIDLSLRNGYNKLAYPKMEEQLLPIINDRKNGIIARRAAIDIAEDCNLDILQDEFAFIALDQSEEYQIRVQAACAVSRIGNDSAKTKLVPLLNSEVNADPDDELKGFSLKSVWPDIITAKTLFSALTKPKRSMYIGAYSSFLSSDFIKNLKESDYLIALKWVESQEANDRLHHKYENIIAAIMFRAFDILNDAQLVDAYAKALLSILEHQDTLNFEYDEQSFKTLLLENPLKRRQLVKTMLFFVPRDKLWMFWGLVQLINKDDLVWLVDELKNSIEKNDQDKWAELIGMVHDPSLIDHTDAIYSGINQSKIVEKYFQHLFAPIELGSLEAENKRQDYLKRQKWMQSHEKPLLDPPPAQRISFRLDDFEAGKIDAWWQLNREMTLKINSTHYGDELESNLTSLPGWENADLQIRTRLINAAKEYLNKAEPNSDTWLGTNIIHFPAFAGYRALRLLQNEDPLYLSELNGEVWEKWAPIIIAYPTSSGTGDENPHLLLVKKAYEYAPEQILGALKILISYENLESDHIFIVRKMELCWNDRLAQTLLDLILELDLKPNCMSNLLDELLAHNIEEARNYTRALIGSYVPVEEVHQERCIVAAVSLITNLHSSDWDIIWSLIQQYPNFGQKTVCRLASKFDHMLNPLVNTLNAEQLADLYIWLETYFPHSEDPQHQDDEMAHWVGPRESVAELRNTLLTALKNRGTDQSCKALERILHEFPLLHWLKWTILDAKHNARRHTWIPPKPNEISILIKNKQKRLVQNGQELLEIILESLDRLQQKFQGQTPAAIDIWNKVKGKYTPMDENALSDRVKRHLEEDLKDSGIVANREVEIRRGEGSGQGERTDIQINAVTKDNLAQSLDIITAIIEVKGCWHSDLLIDMKDQLVDRYLSDNQNNYGLYLVGWFNCDQWDTADPRYKKAKKHDFVELGEFLNKQAKDLSRDGLTIKAMVLNAAVR